MDFKEKLDENHSLREAQTSMADLEIQSESRFRPGLRNLSTSNRDPMTTGQHTAAESQTIPPSREAALRSELQKIRLEKKEVEQEKRVLEREKERLTDELAQALTLAANANSREVAAKKRKRVKEEDVDSVDVNGIKTEDDSDNTSHPPTKRFRQMEVITLD